MGTPIGLNVTCNSDCSRWCPRILTIFCCCRRTGTKEETTETDEKVSRVIMPTIQETSKIDQSID